MVAVTSTMVPLGTPAPDLTLPDPDGRRVSLPAPGEAPAYLVMFICNHCPYVVHVATRLGELAESWMAEGVAVVGVNSNDAEAYPADAPDRMGPTAAEHGWTFPYLVDADQSVAREYGAACTPDFFVYGPDRTLAYRGQFDDSRPGGGHRVTGADLDAAVRAVLSGAAVSSDQVPSIGCNIKWRAES